ncbi:MAG: AMP-binding protein [Candidatus Eremiobacteraeota bacterium]|nr:AMP-binding protein [Candidatus Eremiobacteraeota bacterium]MCW5868328.1 AMP-binding protein [Candidatus Eremiobacteraeota bacterium]
MGSGLNYNLAHPFWLAYQRHPRRVALEQLSYAEVAARASAVARWLGPAVRRVAVLGSRSPAACLAILGSCWSGATYFPLSPNWPGQRIAELLQQIQPDALLVDDRGQAKVEAGWRVLQPEQLDPIPATPPAPLPPEAIAYVIFTSGSTGRPKGVCVSARAVHHLLEAAAACFPLTVEDRYAGNFEFSFDASVFDLFLTWKAGASLQLVPPAQALAPHAFLRRHKITATVLAPCSLTGMERLKLLQPGSLPDLRWSLFGAEALLESQAQLWQQVAPNSQVVSLYGPTENTVTSLFQPLTRPPVVTPERHTIALGRPLPGVDALVVDERNQPVPPGTHGQLVLQGNQLASGYLDDPVLTRQRFRELRGIRSYLTGDWGYQDAGGIFHCLGRQDLQVKVRGHRLELEEVETCLREVCRGAEVAALAWPNRPGHWNEIVAFVSGGPWDEKVLRQQLSLRLPGHGLPRAIHSLARLPRSENGKIDRSALRDWLDARG